MNVKPVNNSSRYFILLASVIFALMFILEKINGRFWLNDFKVFYLASKALLNHEQVYGVAFGLETGFYKYSPFTLLLFAPFTLVSFEVASIIYYVICSACIVAAILLLSRLINRHLFADRELNFLPLLFILLCALNHLVRELHLGNTNMILLLLLTVTLKFVTESRPGWAGLFLAVVVLTKPYFLICLLPLFLFNEFRTILFTCLYLLIFVFISCLAAGLSHGAELYSSWFTAMKEHSGYLSSRQTILSYLDIYFGLKIPSSYGIYILAFTGILFYIYFWLSNKQGAGEPEYTASKNSSLIIYYYLLIAIVPSILITDIEHFLFSLPLIVILILYLRDHKIITMISFALLMFMYGGNSSELIGKKMAAVFEDAGLLGICNLVMIGMVIYLYHTRRLPVINTLKTK